MVVLVFVALGQSLCLAFTLSGVIFISMAESFAYTCII